MMKKIRFLLVSCFMMTVPVLAAPPNTPVLDGKLLEYDSSELPPDGTFIGTNTVFNNVITNLYVTWDAEFLYLALQGQVSGEKVAVLIDVDPSSGTGATTTTNWADISITNDYIRFNDVGWAASDDVSAQDFGMDYMVATEGFFNNILRIRYDGIDTPGTNNVDSLFDNGNGIGPLGTPIDMVSFDGLYPCDQGAMEARIPWSELYYSNRFGTVNGGETIPQGASLRLFANIHNNTPSDVYSQPDTIPQQISVLADWTNGVLTTDSYIDIDLDTNLDGFPDGVTNNMDLNPPWLRRAIGVAGSTTIFAQFNEKVDSGTSEILMNWDIDGDTPSLVQQVGISSVLITTTNPLPAGGTLVTVTATDVDDPLGNTKVTKTCFTTSTGGLSTSKVVRFVLDTDSGLGINPGASNFYLNGSTPPLDWGYPPARTIQLTNVAGDIYAIDVTFPPGTPLEFNYKYSGELSNTGTNTYEAIRLANFADAARCFIIDTNLADCVVTDYLGAAAAPYRDEANTNDTAYSDLYLDLQRGGAGVRERRTVVFQLDLRLYDTNAFDRVLIQGTDPLRGFNVDDLGIGDFAGLPIVGWDEGGIELFDNGTLGDTNAGDGIYARLWSLTTDGTDSALVPDFPNSLVGGDLDTDPYGGLDWADDRSPRSFKYKYYVVKNPSATNAVVYESPGSDIDIYLKNTDTNTVLSPFVWENTSLPLKPASNRADIIWIDPGPSESIIIFTNIPDSVQHGVEVTTSPENGWNDYGQRVVGLPPVFTTTVASVGNDAEFFRITAGAPKPYKGVQWEPNPIPSTGGTLKIYYNQHSHSLAGSREVQVGGTFNGWVNDTPATYMGDGEWYYEVAISSNDADNIEFKPRNKAQTIWEGMSTFCGDNFRAYKGTLRATWTPEMPTNGGSLTITYDAQGGSLDGLTNLNAHIGYEEGWFGAADNLMTSIGSNLWEITITVPTQYNTSVNFIFNNGAGTWDDQCNGGRLWRAFIGE